MKCPQCKRVWKHDSAQSICIELHGNCLTCRRFKLTSSELKSVLREEEKRMNKNLEEATWAD